MNVARRNERRLVDDRAAALGRIVFGRRERNGNHRDRIDDGKCGRERRRKKTMIHGCSSTFRRARLGPSTKRANRGTPRRHPHRHPRA
jgi:hypothetical protein